MEARNPAVPAAQKLFQLGDRVMHTTKPEWGTGHVLSAKPDHEQGEGRQKLQVRFQHGGMKTLSTAFARVASKSARYSCRAFLAFFSTIIAMASR